MLLDPSEATELEKRLERARARWPGVQVTPDQVAAALQKIAVPGSAKDALAELHLEEFYLAVATGLGDPVAVSTFEKQCLAKLDPAIGRVHSDPDFIEDVKQSLRESLLMGRTGGGPKILTYQGRGQLLRWLKAAAVRTALNARRTKGPPVGDAGDDIAQLAVSAGDPQLEAIKHEYGIRFQQALRTATSDLPAQMKLDLKMYYFDGMDLAEIASVYGVDRSTISRRLAKAREELGALARAKLASDLGIEGDRVESVLRAISSQMELSRSMLTGTLPKQS